MKKKRKRDGGKLQYKTAKNKGSCWFGTMVDDNTNFNLTLLLRGLWSHNQFNSSLK